MVNDFQNGCKLQSANRKKKGRKQQKLNARERGTGVYGSNRVSSIYIYIYLFIHLFLFYIHIRVGRASDSIRTEE